MLASFFAAVSCYYYPSPPCQRLARTGTAPQGGDSAVVAPFQYYTPPFRSSLPWSSPRGLRNKHISVYEDMAEVVNLVVVVAWLIAIRSALATPQMQLPAPHIDLHLHHLAQCLR